MKRLATFAIAICIASLSFAQEHMTFKGISIEGDINAFNKSLSATYKKTNNGKGNGIFTGEFFGYNGCTIESFGTELTGIAWKLAVSLPHEKTWRDVVGTYRYVQKSMLEKYGKPYSTIEKFTGPLKIGSGFELQLIADGDECFQTVWDTDNGSILLAIRGVSIIEGYVQIEYCDKEGSILHTTEAKAIHDSRRGNPSDL